MREYGHGHWCVVVDPDEFLVYPFCDTRPIPALTDWLESSSIKSFGAMLLEAPDGRISHFPRAMCRVRTAEGVEGLGWVEWNRNQR